MINPAKFYEKLIKNDISFFTGVPDSLLKDFCSYVTVHVVEKNHIINVNEGAAIALASGYHLSTGKYALVYMQNSGFGNAINPLLSLADPDVYSIPMLLMVGWRGEPGVKDEPQHVKQGRVQIQILEALEIPYITIGESSPFSHNEIDNLISKMKHEKRPCVILISKGVFEPYSFRMQDSMRFTLMREDAIKLIINKLKENDIIVSTTGMTSRELFEYRKSLGHKYGNDFLTVGSMGYCSQIALGIALQKPDRKIFCLDGDGSVLMHMGTLAIAGVKGPANFKHIILNNGAHDSVGGQPTVGLKIKLSEIAEACGYNHTYVIEKPEDINDIFPVFRNEDGPSLMEIRVNKGAREDLGRPTTTPAENKLGFMNSLKK